MSARTFATLTLVILGPLSVASDLRAGEGWHNAHHYGVTNESVGDVWRDVEDGYRSLDGVYGNRHGLWRFGYPVGYGIGAGCHSGGPFGSGPRCCLGPLHYQASVREAFPGAGRETLGRSWYRGEQVRFGR